VRIGRSRSAGDISSTPSVPQATAKPPAAVSASPRNTKPNSATWMISVFE
jgi:hypothetical protein